MVDDAELLQRYARDGSEEAFAELVRRHIDCVYSAALRRLQSDATAAADVTQQVFTALARQAGSLSRRQVVVPAWLYGTTRNLAVDFVRAETRRRGRELKAHMINARDANSTAQVDWDELRPMLEGAMDALSEREREAVLLRFFAQQPFPQIGRTLGLSEDAARMRVDRALDKLHALLAKRGITSTSAALGLVLTGQAVAGAPLGMAASVTGAALSEAALFAATWPAAVTYFMSLPKLTLSLAALAALTLGVAGYRSYQADRTAERLGAAQQSRDSLVARLATLETRARVTESEIAERAGAASAAPAAGRGSAMAKPASATASTNVLTSDSPHALQKALASDPQLLRLRTEFDRIDWTNEWLPLFLSMGMTAVQIDDAGAEYERRANLKRALRDAGVAPPPASPGQFRAGLPDEDAVRQFTDATKYWDYRIVVEDYVSGMFHTDVPLSRQQAETLIQIMADASPPTKGPMDWGARWVLGAVNWDQVLAGAEKVLTGAQLEGLRSLAAKGRMIAQVVAAKNQPAK